VKDLSQRIAGVLAASGVPLTSFQIAERLEIPVENVIRALWEEPQRYAWQPGHRWALAATKRKLDPRTIEQDYEDARPRLLLPQDSTELRAITLASGITLKVIRRPLDTLALFSVRAQGNEVELVLNSANELFSEFPMPFEERDASDADKRLLELLLEAWALKEGDAPPGAAKRALEDVRLMWGRKAVELFTEGK